MGDGFRVSFTNFEKTPCPENVLMQYWLLPNLTLFCTAMIKAFPLALCELTWWLLVSMEISKFVQYHGYLSSVSLRLQMVYPNTLILWLTRQLDWELMFSSIIFLRTANWNKWTKVFTDLLALSIGFTYSLALFIGFGGFVYWTYLLALFIHWFYLFDLVALFIGFIY